MGDIFKERLLWKIEKLSWLMFHYQEYVCEK